MGIADTSIAAVAAAFSGAAAVASWKAAQKANRTAESANRTAESVAQIERDRWHRELTPQVAVQIRERDGQTALYVRFNGPVGMGRLNSISLTIRDDRDRSEDPVLGAGPTAEERAQYIWGPYSFRRGTDGADASGRGVDPFALDVHDERRFALDPSISPPWYEGVEGAQRWRQDHPVTAPLRLWAECRAEGHKPWKLSVETTLGEDWAAAG
ncbi:hypothetical protein [Streptomyces sp. NPDC007355]|uniref:hypothetical protein n=1 Tax=Streptomyces sp. NPDC007355 TaxID=3364778 RepID=UPI0036B81BC9